MNPHKSTAIVAIGAALLADKHIALPRFLAKADCPTTGCWLWTASVGNTGYGKFGVRRLGHIPAHRASWVLHRGPLAPGLNVLHTCDVRLCVNPTHLYLGTLKDNGQDAVARGRTTRGRMGAAKLTVEAVIDIRKRSSLGARNVDLAKEYNVSAAAIYDVKSRRKWAWV